MKDSINELKIYKDVKIAVKITNREHNYISDIVPTHSGKENLNTVEKSVWWSTNVKPNNEKIRKILSINKKIDMIIVNNRDKQYYCAEIVDIVNADKDETISSPDPCITPEYYKDKKFKTWYKLKKIVPIEETSINLDNLVLRYHRDYNDNVIPFYEAINSRPSFLYVIDKDLL